MDVDRFETLLRSLADSPSRRRALGILGGSMLGGVLTLGDPSVSAKKRKGKGKNKKKGKGGQSPPPPGLVCPAGQKVCGATCIPTADCCGGCSLTCCSGTCADLATSGANCGACGHTCTTNQCIHGACDCLTFNTNCPPGCACGARKEGGTASIGGTTTTHCNTDADCPFRSSCLVNDTCSKPCVL